MAKRSTSPLKVTLNLTDGRVVTRDGVIMFDSLLYHAWFMVHAPQVLRGEGDGDAGNIGLPLKQLPGNRWAASRAVYEPLAEKAEYIDKIPDFFSSSWYTRCSATSGNISTTCGQFRAWRLPLSVMTVKDGKLDFWCMGNAEGVARLLDEMQNVGKKASIGYGRIDSYDIDDVPEDWSLWHPEQGLMRPVIVGEAKPRDCMYQRMMYGIRPPYWKRCNAYECYVPVQR